MSQEEKTKAKKKKKTTEKAENFLEEAEEEPSKAEMKKEEEAKEGHFLLGPPTFTQLENGRFRCSETGHEMPSKEMESYGRSKRCRVGLIDAFLQLNKAPLNSFYQDPLCKSKLICKLTGDTINKSEEHIWKHISGKRFQHKLEQKEAEKATPAVMEEKKEKLSPKASKLSKKSITKDVKGKVRKGDSQAKEHLEKSSDSEELDFWVPPVGSRWDFDDGADRWGSSADSGDEKDEGIGIGELKPLLSWNCSHQQVYKMRLMKVNRMVWNLRNSLCGQSGCPLPLDPAALPQGKKRKGPNPRVMQPAIEVCKT